MPAPAVSSRWIEKRRPHWDRLESLVARGPRATKAFTHAELRELALLYRQAAADLATVREHPANAQLALYLNRLLGSAHNLIYGARPARFGAIISFYGRTVPRIFRETWRYTAGAVALFAAGALGGAVLSAADPGFERFVLGGEMMDTIERREMWTHSILAMKPLASSAILTNNLSVSFAAFATGIFAGLGTLYIMAFNGLLIGVIAAACHRVGMSVPLWSFVAPHGALELPAIFIAGGAGFVLARGVLVPGTLPRRESLAEAAGTSIRLLLGVIPLLIVAGLIEGFVSPVDITPAGKFLIGGAMFTLLALYLTAAPAPSPPDSGRSARSPAPPATPRRRARPAGGG
ncbi:MAG TPA: stage II sporulation protein M [Vicinamibacterales bacterium]|nr:stage II sporulation protein M [Vicinamibacterales bacterium]